MILGICVGILPLVLGLYPLFILIKRKIQCTEFVMGRIIDEHIGDTINDQYPIYEYDVQGKIYKKQSKQREPYVQIGKKIKIYYNPNNPDEYLAEGENGMSYIIFLVIIPIVLGIIVICSSL